MLNEISFCLVGDKQKGLQFLSTRNRAKMVLTLSLK